LTFLLMISLGRFAWTAPLDEVSDALTRAQSLYYEAKFTESIRLLSHVDELLRTQPERLQEKISVKLQLALAHIGLNDTPKAKAFLRELYAVDGDYSLDAQQFSPKVIGLAAQAKAEQHEIRCQAAGAVVRKNLDAGNAKGSMDLIGSMKSKCSDLAALEPELAELFYKTGFEAYKRRELPDAIQNFQATLRLAPKHDLAGQYMELTQDKLQVTGDRLFLQWQKNFDSRDFVQAADDYRRLESFNDESNAQMIAQAQTEYRRALTNLVGLWNRACKSGDSAEMTSIGTQIAEMLPEPAFGEDIRGQMTTCTKTSCLQMNATMVMARLKTRVSPDISPALQDFVRESQITVQVKGRIDESGNVSVTGAEGSNSLVNAAVRAAVERWKFSPIADQSGPRCVDTEIPIVLKF